jgi:phosphoenolpyruvate carboxylase
MYNQKDWSDSELAEMLPHTMGTQHPDNISAVPFGNSPVVSRVLEEEEVLYNISTLGL